MTGLIGHRTQCHYFACAGGLVQETKFTVLPQISPLLSFLLTMLSMSPCLVLLWKKPHPKYFMESIAYANLCAFVWGYHVHEKAILTVGEPQYASIVYML